jgi:membrane peptidoglycan carboxypeptidase
VIAELEGLGITEQDIARDGLRITTTIDPDRQQHAAAAAQDALDGRTVNVGSAMVAIDPETGGVLAYYGGDDGLGTDYAQVRRVAGSTFEPFVVLAGLMQDPPVGPGEAVVGPAEIAAAARAAGITSPLDDPDYRIALGDTQVSTFELASAYATIAAGGVWRPPHLVASVATADGRVLYQAATDGERRFPEPVARNVTESMLAVAEPGGLSVAARSGTVRSQFEGESNHARMAGFTPSLSSAVWTGVDFSSPIQTARSSPIQDAISLPGTVWQQFISTVTDHETTHHDPPNHNTTDDEPTNDEPAEDAAATPTPQQVPEDRSGLRRLFGAPDEAEPTEQDCLLLPCGSS